MIPFLVMLSMQNESDKYSRSFIQDLNWQLRAKTLERGHSLMETN